MTLKQPINSNALALYLLLEKGMRGITTYDAILDCDFYKLSTRISDLILDYDLKVHKKIESGVNRFKHSYNRTRYCLYTSDKKKNIELYNKINVAK